MGCWGWWNGRCGRRGWSGRVRKWRSISPLFLLLLLFLVLTREATGEKGDADRSQHGRPKPADQGREGVQVGHREGGGGRNVGGEHPHKMIEEGNPFG